MSFTCDQNMGNSMRVERVPVHTLNGSAGKTGAPIIPRGTIVAFDFNLDNEQVDARTNPAMGLFRKQGQARTADGDSHVPAFGVLAEAVVDHARRKTRPGRKPTPLVLPVTMDGIDIATAPNPHTGFVPGDPVWYHFDATDADGSRSFLHKGSRPPHLDTFHGTAYRGPNKTAGVAQQEITALLVGTAVHNAPPNTNSVQLRVHGVAYAPSELNFEVN